MFKIFISYRRADSVASAGRIYDKLVAQFGTENVFMDFESMRPGADFPQFIKQSIIQSKVFLTIIGLGWLNARDLNGTHRIDDPKDLVHIEIETALQQGIPIIPILVDGAQMPSHEQLPLSLQKLADFNAMVVTNNQDFNHHMSQVIRSIQEFLNTSHDIAASSLPRSEGQESKEGIEASSPNYQSIVLALKQAQTRLALPIFERFAALHADLANSSYDDLGMEMPQDGHHGIAHVRRVLANLASLLGDNPLGKAFLMPYELYLTVMSVLYHDFKFFKSYRNTEKFDYLLIKDEHNAYLVDEHDRLIIQSAVPDHLNEDAIDKRCAMFSDEELIAGMVVRPRVIAALVRLADNLDADYRWTQRIRPDDLPTSERQLTCLQISKRILGIRPFQDTGSIVVSLRFDNADRNMIVKTDQRFVPLVVAVETQLLYLNRERVSANRYLPSALVYRNLLTSVKPLNLHMRWSEPREFTFTDHTSHGEFVAALPELLADPAREQMGSILEHIRRWELQDAEARLIPLRDMFEYLPIDMKLKVLYDSACVRSLQAQVHRTGSKEQRVALDESLGFLKDWIELGMAGAWAEVGGETPQNQIHRMGTDSDLWCVLKWRRNQIASILREAAQF